MKSFLLFLVPFLAVAGLVAPASGSDLAAAHGGVVGGLITAAGGIPVPDAIVVVEVRSPDGRSWIARTHSDRHGRYVFHDVPPGHGVVHAGHPRAGRGAERFDLHPGETLRVNVALR